MILSDRTLWEKQIKGLFPTDVLVGPCSVDLTLSNSFAKIRDNDEFRQGFIRLSSDRVDYDYQVGVNRYLLEPHGFVLATTHESIKIPKHMAGFVHGRSSVGRAGLQVQNAGFIDAGFEGKITLELFNQTKLPILLEAGIRICQISYHLLDTEVRNPYSGKYQNQADVCGSLIHLD